MVHGPWPFIDRKAGFSYKNPKPLRRLVYLMTI